MHKDTIVIREIEPDDDPKIAQAIRSVLIEMGVPKVGTAYEDKALDCMTETYNQPRKKYFVVVKRVKIIGGAGISPLDNYVGNVCELQKMYFLPEASHKGLGQQMIDKCLEFAKEQNFKHCYIETMPNMLDAQNLYKKNGFYYINHSMGATGHTSCPIWMIKELS